MPALPRFPRDLGLFYRSFIVREYESGESPLLLTGKLISPQTASILSAISHYHCIERNCALFSKVVKSKISTKLVSDNLWGNFVSDDPSQKPSFVQPAGGQPDGQFRVVPAANGLLWIKRAIRLFKQNPAAWLSCSLIMMFTFTFVILITLVVPILFPLLFILNAIFTGGLMLGSLELRHHRVFNVKSLFSGYEKHASRLSIVGLIYFIATMVCYILAFALSDALGHEVYKADFNKIVSDPAEAQKVLESLIFPLLFFMGLLIPVIMAFWFAPALTVFFNEPPVQAMKKSLRACAVNTLPFLIYGIVTLFGVLFCSIIIGALDQVIPLLGAVLKFIFNLTLTSLIITSIFTAFEDIFPNLDEPENQPDTPETDSLIA